jgi:hypothetical protein
MDIITLASTAFTYALPYLVKSGEKISENLGQEVWDFIKKPFSKEGVDMTLLENQEEFQDELLRELKEDSDFEMRLRDLVKTVEEKLNAGTEQNVNNYGNIEKQVNVGNVSGDINL